MSGYNFSNGAMIGHGIAGFLGADGDLARKFNSAEAQKQRNWEERMSNTAL